MKKSEIIFGWFSPEDLIGAIRSSVLKLTPNPPHPTDSSEEMPRIAVLFEVLFNATCLAVGIKN